MNPVVGAVKPVIGAVKGTIGAVNGAVGAVKGRALLRQTGATAGAAGGVGTAARIAAAERR